MWGSSVCSRAGTEEKHTDLRRRPSATRANGHRCCVESVLLCCAAAAGGHSGALRAKQSVQAARPWRAGVRAAGSRVQRAPDSIVAHAPARCCCRRLLLPLPLLLGPETARSCFPRVKTSPQQAGQQQADSSLPMAPGAPAHLSPQGDCAVCGMERCSKARARCVRVRVPGHHERPQSSRWCCWCSCCCSSGASHRDRANVRAQVDPVRHARSSVHGGSAAEVCGSPSRLWASALHLSAWPTGPHSLWGRDRV